MITAKSAEEFREQLSQLFKQDEFSNLNNIVYLWKVENAIPRLIGESDILYIGRTKNTFSSRYRQKKAIDIELAYFESVYRHVISKYGQITIKIKVCSDTKVEEAVLLHAYFKKHSELPPMNRSMPRLCA